MISVLLYLMAGRETFTANVNVLFISDGKEKLNEKK